MADTCATLRLLSRQELTHYIEHRCHLVGATSIPFDSQASEALYEIGRGNLRGHRSPGIGVPALRP